MLRIAITGGIGSGKTAVTNYLEYLGFTVVDADVISREMTGPGGCAIERIAEVFGPDIASIEKGLSREYIRTLIFSNNEMKQKFEDIVTKSVIKAMNYQERALFSLRHHFYLNMICKMIMMQFG